MDFSTKLSHALANRPLLDIIRDRLPDLIQIAQRLYDNWNSGKPGNGLCSYIAESWSDYFNNTSRSDGIRATEHYPDLPRFTGHVSVLVYTDDAAYVIDLPHSLYEVKVSKSRWSKIPGKVFNPSQVVIAPAEQE